MQDDQLALGKGVAEKNCILGLEQREGGKDHKRGGTDLAEADERLKVKQDDFYFEVRLEWVKQQTDCD